MESSRLSIRIPESLRSGLATLVETTGRSESEIARDAIEEYLRRHSKQPTCFDLAVQAGMIGCVETGIPDLSTNPRHMKGFGE